jgi:hypothetical protein
VISMRSLGGFVLLAGIGVGLFVYLPAPVDSGASRDRLGRLAFSGSAWLYPVEVAPVSRLGSFSPSVALSTPARRGQLLANLGTTVAPAPAPQPAQAPIASGAQSGWQTTVVSAATPAPTELTARDPDARNKLVLDIQQQLKRVGCYRGRMDSSWGFATRDAMKEFTDRVNATLPLDEPDYVQLALIQSQSDEVCGACPPGQSLSASGRCVGLPITAQTVAATQKDVLPSKANATPGAAAALLLFKPVQMTMGPTEPVPGRMALGAPVPASVDVQQDAPPVTPGAAAEPPGTVTAALDPSAVKPPVTATPNAKHRSSSSDRRRAGPNHRPRFAGDYGRSGPDTPRHNLLLSLGGLY